MKTGKNICEYHNLRYIFYSVSDYKQPKFRDASSNEKNVLIVGATGSGKSTLIDAMINHIVDVSFGDGCRFKMIDLTDDEKRNEGKQV